MTATFSQRAVEAAAEAMKQRRRGEIERGRDYATFDELASLALTAALAVDGVALQGWRPIESAPKDGTRILWSCGDDKMSVVYWPDYELCFEGGYWMPLPPPPAASEGEERPSPLQEKR